MIKQETFLKASKAYNLKAKVATFTIGSSYDITNTLTVTCNLLSLFVIYG